MRKWNRQPVGANLRAIPSISIHQSVTVSSLFQSAQARFFPVVRDFRLFGFDQIAAGLQCFTEDLIRRWIAATVANTGDAKVLGAGGVFMNVKGESMHCQNCQDSNTSMLPSCGDETFTVQGGLAIPPSSRWRAGRYPLDDLYLGPEAGTDFVGSPCSLQQRRAVSGTG